MEVTAAYRQSQDIEASVHAAERYEDILTSEGTKATLSVSFANNGGTSQQAYLIVPKEYISKFNQAGPNPVRITPTGRFVFDLKRAKTRATRRKRQRAEAKAAKRKQFAIRLAKAFNFSEPRNPGKPPKVKTYNGNTLVRYRTNPTFRNDVGLAANGTTFFTLMTDAVLRYWANHILAYGSPKTSVKEAHDPANGFYDFQWIGDMVEDGLLGIKKGRVVCDSRVSKKVRKMVGEGRKVRLTEGQAKYWQKHQETIFGRGV